MHDNHSTIGSTGQNSAAGQHQDPSFGDQPKNDNPDDYDFFQLDGERLDDLRREAEQLFADRGQAQYTAAGSTEHGCIERDKDKVADTVPAVAESAPHH
jgi:hypothetical protein